MTFMENKLRQLYQSHAEFPYISPERDIAEFLEEVAISSGKLVPKRNMIRVSEGYLPGHLILLWRIQFGTYTNETVISKYFEYSYGIDAQKELELLIHDGLVVEDTALASLTHLPAGKLKLLLKEKGVKGLSKMKREDLDKIIAEEFTEEELARQFSIRGYHLSKEGEALLNRYPEIIAKHPQKKF